LTALSGGAGVVAGAAAATGTVWQASLPGLLPLSGLTFGTDALSGWFLLLVGGVTAVAGVYVIGYAGRDGHGPSSRGAMAVLPLFTAAMLLVPAAASVSTFLLSWELMAVTSLVLVLTEHRHSPAVRSAGVWYAAMTQAGFVVIAIGLMWLAAAAESQSFMDIARVAPALSPIVAGGVFVLCPANYSTSPAACSCSPRWPSCGYARSRH
jgi:formate hydrogenlyase subunit 3/multisubunit Na+/H+ antiporter MnhD subunit